MTIAELLLPEFDQEMANTRKVLALVPPEKFDWKAHAKSNTIGWVTRHLAEIPGWTNWTLNQPSLDLEPPGGKKFTPSTETDLNKILALFDKNVADAKTAIAATSDATFAEPWSLLKGGAVLMTMPKYNVMRSFVLNHTVHHRAFLCSYLRMIDVPIPGMYGPSGDESAF